MMTRPLSVLAIPPKIPRTDVASEKKAITSDYGQRIEEADGDILLHLDLSRMSPFSSSENRERIEANASGTCTPRILY